MSTFVCQLIGKDVWGTHQIIGIIDSMNDAQKVVEYCEKKYNISFEKEHEIVGFKSFRCTDYSKDVTICIERVNSLFD